MMTPCRATRLFRGATVAACMLVAGAVPAAAAMDVSLSGFGTVGYAISDERFAYLRYIDRNGTFKTDTLVGFQAEAAITPEWSATLQAVASAPRSRDHGYEASIRWAFVSFRPTNDWLFRVGRIRVPVFIHTQNAEVGVTYDQARLPAEVYTLSPVYDVDGGALTKTWTFGDREVSLDAYAGKPHIRLRVPIQRDPASAARPPLDEFVPTGYLGQDLVFAGVVVSQTKGPLFLRAGLHHARAKLAQRIPETYVPTTIPAPAPLGGTLWLPGRLVDVIDVTVLTLGADWRAADWRITAEYGQRIVNDTDLGFDSRSAYVTLSRAIGPWTPYFTHARLLSGSSGRTLFERLEATPVPLLARASLPADYHHVLADSMYVYDQYSSMVGAAYSFSATSKLKAEWMQTKIGLRSSLVDGNLRNERVNTLTLAYSFVF